MQQVASCQVDCDLRSRGDLASGCARAPTQRAGPGPGQHQSSAAEQRGRAIHAALDFTSLSQVNKICRDHRAKDEAMLCPRTDRPG